jgi:hypothetical protein
MIIEILHIAALYKIAAKISALQALRIESFLPKIRRQKRSARSLYRRNKRGQVKLKVIQVDQHIFFYLKR